MALFAAVAAMSFQAADSTAYCVNGTTASGAPTGPRTAASNRHSLGTKIRLTRPGPGGIQIWTIRDRIGSGSELDFWAGNCSSARKWGRRKVYYRVIGR